MKACGYGRVGCDDVWFGGWVLNFRRNLLTSSSGYMGRTSTFTIFVSVYQTTRPHVPQNLISLFTSITTN